MASGNKEVARGISEALRDIGLHDVLELAGDARTVALGVRIGLQTDARKGRGGTLYENAVEDSLRPIVDGLQADGYPIRFETQYQTGYKPENREQKKRVDFAILRGDDLLVAFEANCYTTGGSKVSSTEREYDDLSSKMRSDRRAFVWITDGYGWKTAERSTLAEAYDDVHDLYNLYMVDRLIEDDLRVFLQGVIGGDRGNTLEEY
jgi:type II restriction enzyme